MGKWIPFINGQKTPTCIKWTLITLIIALITGLDRLAGLEELDLLIIL